MGVHYHSPWVSLSKEERELKSRQQWEACESRRMVIKAWPAADGVSGWLGALGGG